MAGWGRGSMNITQSDKVLPCDAAESSPGLAFENIRDHRLRDIWLNAPSFQRYRSTAWMQEPCQSCDLKEVDWGGCRCQAIMIAGDAAADPACDKSPWHGKMQKKAESAPASGNTSFVYRNYRNNTGVTG